MSRKGILFRSYVIVNCRFQSFEFSLVRNSSTKIGTAIPTDENIVDVSVPRKNVASGWNRLPSVGRTLTEDGWLLILMCCTSLISLSMTINVHTNRFSSHLVLKPLSLLKFGNIWTQSLGATFFSNTLLQEFYVPESG